MHFLLACLLAPALTFTTQDGPSEFNEELVRAYLWPQTADEFAAAEVRISKLEGLDDLDLKSLRDLEEWLRRGRDDYPPAPAATGGRIPVQRISVPVGTGVEIPVFVRLPSRYHPQAEWPLMFAMHGGPPARADRVEPSAERMLKVWAQPAERAGWIVAAPAMTTTLTAAGRNAERLPYEIFQPEIARAVINALRARFHIDSNRVVSTGISLGSNFSIAYGAAHPDWFSAIVPVSTEGDSREHLLRNLLTVPTYVLEGSRDRNIRGVGGPRALNAILTRLGYDLTYREFGDRSHEGFQEHYDDVLRWCNERPRRLYPRTVVRVPHQAIVPTGLRVHWIESDTRQGLLRASVRGSQRIEITGRWLRRVKLFLHDRLVNLGEPFEVWINGQRVHSGRVPRSARTALAQARELGDSRRIYVAELELEMPPGEAALEAGKSLWRQLTPKQQEGRLSYWEMYATRALQERFGGLGLEGREVDLPQTVSASPEQVGLLIEAVDQDGPLAAIDLRPGDLLIEFGGEPFYRDHGGVAALEAWLLRELRARPATYKLRIGRGDQILQLSLPLQLGPDQQQ